MRERLRDPLAWSNALQVVKTVGAAVVAWVLAGQVFNVAQPFLAPWAALLTVHATVYRTFARGLQQVTAAVLGVLLAFVVGGLLGVNAASLAIALLVAMAAGTTRALRAESTTAAATALVVLLTGYSGDASMLGGRLFDTVVGIGVGLLVNFLVWPPLRDRSAARRVDVIDDRLGELLTDIADGMREGCDADDAERWVQRTRELDDDIDDAWAVVRQARESGRLNVRRAAGRRIGATGDLADLLGRLEQAVADTRSMAATIGRATGAEWDPRFRELWIDLVTRTGAAVSAADADDLARVGEDLRSAAGELFAAGTERAPRPAHGALIVNLRNIVEAMDAVAEAQPVRIDAREPVA